jgi:hypothetical protein
MKPKNIFIHVIESAKRNYLSQLGKNGKAWESGFWPLPEDIAKNLIGGSIFFHEKKSGPSFCSGIILDCRIHSRGEWKGQVIIQFEYLANHRQVWVDAKGWRQNMKIVHECPRLSLI